jgi:CRISPR-associated protein Cmr4
MMENNILKGWCKPDDVVFAGLEWAEYLGVGGMGTRGFGRIRGIKV